MRKSLPSFPYTLDPAAIPTMVIVDVADDLTPERKAAIHKATVDAKLAGLDTGATPFVACLHLAGGVQ